MFPCFLCLVDILLVRWLFHMFHPLCLVDRVFLLISSFVVFERFFFYILWITCYLWILCITNMCCVLSLTFFFLLLQSCIQGRRKNKHVIEIYFVWHEYIWDNIRYIIGLCFYRLFCHNAHVGMVKIFTCDDIFCHALTPYFCL